MQPDPVAAAWGLSQVRFAFLVQELADAVFYLQRRTQAKLQFSKIMKKMPSQLLDALETELNAIAEQDKRFAREVGQEEHLRPEIEELRALLLRIEELKDWRDARIHSRVELEPSIALYSWKTRKQLAMTAAECREKSDLAVSFAMKIRGEVGSLLRALKADETMLRELSIDLDPVQDD